MCELLMICLPVISVIIISTSNSSFASKEILTISDTGKGIDESVLGKIFDPFFTTKKSGKGTGLGLSVVHGIVHNANGYINVNSRFGKGTEFHIYLPIVVVNVKQHLPERNVSIPHGYGQILLVDDENAIVLMERRMLERLGYRVVSRTSSIDALEASGRIPESLI